MHGDAVLPTDKKRGRVADPLGRIHLPEKHVSSRSPAFPSRATLDDIDVRILAVLQRDGRIAKIDLARMVGLSPSACLERMRRLEKEKVVLSYHANIDLTALMPAQMFMTEVTLKRHHASDFARFEGFIQKVPRIVECHSVGGGIDYMLKIVTQDVPEYQAIIDELLEAEIGIDRYFTYVVTKPVKHLFQFQIEAGAG